MSEKGEQLNSLKKISNIVNDNDQKIWENETYHSRIQKEIEKINEKLARALKRMDELDSEDFILDKYLENLSKSLVIQGEALAINQQSLINQQVMKHNADEDRSGLKKRYAIILDEFKDELIKQRTDMENKSETYQILKFEQLKLKKLRIKEMELISTINRRKNIKRQFRQIQEQKFHVTVVEFAGMMLDYNKCEEQAKSLQKLKVEEKEALKEFLELEEALKRASKAHSHRFNQHSKDQFLCDGRQQTEVTVPVSGKNGTSSDEKNGFSQTLEDFMIQDLEPMQQGVEENEKSLSQFVQKKRSFSSNHAKIRILDQQVVAGTHAVPAPELQIPKSPARRIPSNVNPTLHKAPENKDSISKQSQPVQKYNTEKPPSQKIVSKFFNPPNTGVPAKKTVTFRNDHEKLTETRLSQEANIVSFNKQIVPPVVATDLQIDETNTPAIYNVINVEKTSIMNVPNPVANPPKPAIPLSKNDVQQPRGFKTILSQERCLPSYQTNLFETISKEDNRKTFSQKNLQARAGGSSSRSASQSSQEKITETNEMKQPAESTGDLFMFKSFDNNNFGFKQFGDKMSALGNISVNDQSMDVNDPFAFNTSYANMENVSDTSQDNPIKLPTQFSFGGMNSNPFNMY